MAKIQSDDYITTGEAASLKGISPQLLRYYMQRGYTPEPIKIGRYSYFELSKITKWSPPNAKTS